MLNDKYYYELVLNLNKTETRKWDSGGEAVLGGDVSLLIKNNTNSSLSLSKGGLRIANQLFFEKNMERGDRKQKTIIRIIDSKGCWFKEKDVTAYES